MSFSIVDSVGWALVRMALRIAGQTDSLRPVSDIPQAACGAVCPVRPECLQLNYTFISFQRYWARPRFPTSPLPHFPKHGRSPHLPPTRIRLLWVVVLFFAASPAMLVAEIEARMLFARGACRPSLRPAFVAPLLTRTASRCAPSLETLVAQTSAPRCVEPFHVPYVGPAQDARASNQQIR